jgi:hemoglobin
MRSIRAIAISVALASMTLAAPAAAQESLYKRLGGYDAVAAVTDEFLGRLTADAGFKKFFAGHSEDSHRRIRQDIVDFVCQSAGGPCVYTGRPMKTAHKGLKITKAEWDRSAAIFVEVLSKFKVPEPLQKEVVGFIASLEKDIVE